MIYCDECDLVTDDVEVAYQCQTCYSMLHHYCIADHCAADRQAKIDADIGYGGQNKSTLIDCSRPDVRLLAPCGPALISDPRPEEEGK